MSNYGHPSTCDSLLIRDSITTYSARVHLIVAITGAHRCIFHSLLPSRCGRVVRKTVTLFSLCSTACSCDVFGRRKLQVCHVIHRLSFDSHGAGARSSQSFQASSGCRSGSRSWMCQCYGSWKKSWRLLLVRSSATLVQVTGDRRQHGWTCTFLPW